MEDLVQSPVTSRFVWAPSLPPPTKSPRTNLVRDRGIAEIRSPNKSNRTRNGPFRGSGVGGQEGSRIRTGVAAGLRQMSGGSFH